MDDIYIKVKLEKRVKNDKATFVLKYQSIAESYKKYHKETFNHACFYNSTVWAPKEGHHVLGYATRKIAHLGETGDFKRELRRKGEKSFDTKNEMDLSKTRYEAPNLKYIKRGS
tara:strand:- start:217 stop:558 length:342 start_codon:yes stop_codon:yes gene_type:complete